MNCNQIHELLPDLAAGMEASPPAATQHIASCADCAARLSELQKTMALLDEWQTPEPVSYTHLPKPKPASRTEEKHG